MTGMTAVVGLYFSGLLLCFFCSKTVCLDKRTISGLVWETASTCECDVPWVKTTAIETATCPVNNVPSIAVKGGQQSEGWEVFALVGESETAVELVAVEWELEH